MLQFARNRLHAPAQRRMIDWRQKEEAAQCTRSNCNAGRDDWLMHHISDTWQLLAPRDVHRGSPECEAVAGQRLGAGNSAACSINLGEHVLEHYTL